MKTSMNEELADKLMQCYDSRELPSWYEIYDASTRLTTLSRQLAEAQAEKIALQNALVIIDGIALRHKKGGIGKAQRVAREALAHAAAMGTEK